jgi:inner membrane protein
MIGSALNALGLWAWIILGLALMGLELLAPGVFLLWLGLASPALSTGPSRCPGSPRRSALRFSL